MRNNVPTSAAGATADCEYAELALVAGLSHDFFEELVQGDRAGADEG